MSCLDLGNNCLTCKNQDTCLSCEDGYYLLNHECIEDGSGLSGFWIAMIVIVCLIVVFALGVIGWYCWKKR